MSPKANEVDNEEIDLWETSSGSFSEYEGVVREARFGFDAAYNSGNSLLLLLTIETDPELGIEDNERTEMYTVGTGWDEAEDGETCVNSRGVLGGTARGARYNDQGGCGLLMNALKTSDGFEAGIVKNPYLASSYVGLGVEFTGVEFTKPINGEDVTYTRTLPIRVWREDAAKPAKAAAKAPAKKAPAKAAASAAKESPAAAAKARAAAKRAAAEAEAAGGDEGGLEGQDQVDALVTECNDYDTFVERAYSELEVVIESEELQAYVDDPSNFDFDA